MTKTINKLLLLALTSIMYNTPAHALAGLDEAKSTITTVTTGVYSMAGVVAGLYLLYLGLMAKTERKSWSDFFWGIGHIALVGGALLLATWAWGLFTG